MGSIQGNLATATGFSLAIVLTVQGLTGWEAAVPLAEETENPRRNVPRATMLSIAIIGTMLVLAIWGQVIGWGINNITTLPGSSELPALVIAHRVWGSLWWLALLAMTTSVIGGSLAAQNVATRMWFGMGRSGVLPQTFAKVHPTRKTPTTAVTAQFILSMALGLLLPLFLNPTEVFLLTVGYTLVIAVICVYVIANVAVVVYYWREAREEFNWILHFIFPVGTSIVLIYSVYKAFYPLPVYPYNWSPFIVAAWLIIGIIVVIGMNQRGNKDWLTKAGAIIDERIESPKNSPPNTHTRCKSSPHERHRSPARDSPSHDRASAGRTGDAGADTRSAHRPEEHRRDGTPDGRGCTWDLRPHARIDKSPILGRMQLDAGGIGLTTATIWEASVHARGGPARLPGRKRGGGADQGGRGRARGRPRRA